MFGDARARARTRVDVNFGDRFFYLMIYLMGKMGFLQSLIKDEGRYISMIGPSFIA